MSFVRSHRTWCAFTLLGLFSASGLGVLLSGCFFTKSGDPNKSEDNLYQLPESKKDKEFIKFDLIIKDFCTEKDAGSNSIYTLQDVFVINASYKFRDGKLLIDWDRDGVLDFDEYSSQLELSTDTPITPGGGWYGDLAQYVVGLTPDARSQLNNLFTCENPGVDTDHDGISDCDERAIIKSNPKYPDTDFDGIPDGIELRAGLNPTAQDAFIAPAGDGVPNITKVKWNMPITNKIAGETQNWHPEYSIITDEKVEDCFRFEVRKIPIVATDNDNLILVDVLQKSKNINAPLEDQNHLLHCCYLVPSSTENKSAITVSFDDLTCPCPGSLDPLGSGE